MQLLTASATGPGSAWRPIITDFAQQATKVPYPCAPVDAPLLLRAAAASRVGIVSGPSLIPSRPPDMETIMRLKDTDMAAIGIVKPGHLKKLRKCIDELGEAASRGGPKAAPLFCPPSISRPDLAWPKSQSPTAFSFNGIRRTSRRNPPRAAQSSKSGSLIGRR